MAVKMRLMRMGKKRSPIYRVVVMDGRAPRDGRYIDQLGRYDPNHEPSLIEIDADKAIDWLKKGAQPTEAVRKLLEISGAMSRYKVASGKIHTVAAKAPAPVTDAADGDAEEPAAEEPAAEDTVTEDPVADDAAEASPADDSATEPTAEETEADVAEDAATEEE